MDVAVIIVLLLLGAAMTAPKLPASGWVYPIPDLKRGTVLYPAVISSGFGTPRKGVDYAHRGVDLDYRRGSADDLITEFPPGTAGGSAMHFMPTGIPVFAARDGVVWSAGKTERGHAVVISHEAAPDGKPFATFYQHLSTLAIGPHARGVNTVSKTPTKVTAGALIGIVGGDPTVKPSFRHLHFALWYGGTDESSIDPASLMASWKHLTWTTKG